MLHQSRDETIKLECNNCKNNFDMKVKVKKHKGSIEEVYFICPNCNERYTSYYTDKTIRDMQGEVGLLYEGLRASSNRRKSRREIKRSKDKIQLKMNELREHLES